MGKYRYILFDLDGTLTESATGIINSVIYALKHKGIEEQDREKLLAFVGPPLTESMKKYYGLTDAEVKELLPVYREYFDDRGWRENRVYEGIPQMLKKLRDQGKHLILATSKPETAARRILSYFSLDEYFEIIGGSTLDGRIEKKGQVIDMVIGRAGREHTAEMIMVGDREHDVIGARENKLPCVGVLYGYGSREELEKAGAAAICPDVQSLPEILDAF